MYLIRFERACAAFEIRPEFWSTQLARLLQGRSVDVYQRLPAEEVDNYESLKTQLLKRFRLTEGGYRKKFKMSILELGETPEQFVERLNRYLVKWCEMCRAYSNGPCFSVRLSVRLPSDSRSEVRLRHFGFFKVGTSPIQREMGSWHSEWISGNSHKSRHLTVLPIVNLMADGRTDERRSAGHYCWPPHCGEPANNVRSKPV